jgi:Double zinc ribbon
MMTSCASCGSPAGVEDRFCATCGSPLGEEAPAAVPGASFCTSCGTPLDPEDRFCGRCGAPVRARSGLAEEGEDDLLADWDLEVSDKEPPEPDEAVTESIPRPARVSDTTVIEELPEPAPAPYIRPHPPVREPRAPVRGVPLGATFALLGAVAVVVSATLEWNGPFGPDLPRDIAFRLLFDPTGPATGINLGVVLLIVGTVGALVAILTMALPALKPIRRVIGLLTLAIPAGFAVRTFQLALTDGSLLDLPSLLGPGVYVALVGAFIEMVAGKWFGR